MRCPPSQECLAGACVRTDECAGVDCPEDDTVCSHGTCVSVDLDEDGDGSPAALDCDDLDPDVREGSTQACQTGCAPGTSTCEAGVWQPCTEPECTCAPGDQREEVCGRCGQSEVECGDDGVWGAPGRCRREGPCAPGDVESSACGNCGTQERTCDAGCRWGAFGACLGDVGCGCVPGNCVAGWTCCPGLDACVDLTSDSSNCGACGAACAIGEQCIHRADTGQTFCSRCIPDDCAAFGAVCCPGNDACVAFYQDEQNCGGCGLSCAADEHCIYEEHAGRTECTRCNPDDCGAFGASCCPGVDDSCIAFFQDEQNCGGCGLACPGGQFCILDEPSGRIGCAACDPDACAAFGVHCCPGVADCVDGPC